MCAETGRKPVRRFTYMPWAEVERNSERGAAISLPLQFRARALESAAVASRIMEDADRNGAVFTSTVSPTAAGKPAAFGLQPTRSHRRAAWTSESHSVRRETPVSLRNIPLNATPFAFVSKATGRSSAVLGGLVSFFRWSITSQVQISSPFKIHTHAEMKPIQGNNKN